MNSTNKEQLLKHLNDRATKLTEPIDFEQLTREGLLVRDGDWYRVLKGFRALPEVVRNRVEDVKFYRHELLVRF